jgi:hypothetical protein
MVGVYEQYTDFGRRRWIQVGVVGGPNGGHSNNIATALGNGYKYSVLIAGK